MACEVCSSSCTGLCNATCLGTCMEKCDGSCSHECTIGCTGGENSKSFEKWMHVVQETDTQNTNTPGSKIQQLFKK